MRLKISARKSDLARLQAYMVGAAIQKKTPAIEIEYRFKESLGDKNLTDPLWKIPEKGVFTEDFNQELLTGETDMVVHSWKDLPTEIRPHSEIIATLPRADQRDLLLVKKSHLAQMKATGQVHIYSSSPRRAYNLTGFLKEVLPLDIQNVDFESVRGNIPTRIRKLIEAPDVQGLIVAKAALDRLLAATESEFAEMQAQLRNHLEQLEWMVLPLSINPNAAAQGALAVEILKSREDLKELFAEINDRDTYHCAEQERKILASFGGGCHQKIGIAILRRPYGDIHILKGLTKSDQLLDQHELLRGSKIKFAAKEMWPEANEDVKVFARTPLPQPLLPTNANALLVSKAEAWPDDFKFSKIIWAAGLNTWKKLAQKGVWVQGCAEGLGEQEDPRLEHLTTEKLNWYKLSHADGVASDKCLIPTYRLVCEESPPAFSHLSHKKSFFWGSGSLFLQAIQRHPQIIDAQHACGPGHTYQIIRDTLEKQNFSPEDHLQIFLNQDEWRKKCQI